MGKFSWGLKKIPAAVMKKVLRYYNYITFLILSQVMFGPVENSGRPEYPDWGLRDEIAHLAIEAYRREIISRGRLLELGVSLEIRGEILLDLAEGACDN